MNASAGSATPTTTRRSCSSTTSPRCCRTRRCRPATTIGWFATDAAVGECRVICFSPRHDLTLADDAAGGGSRGGGAVAVAARRAVRALFVGADLRDPRSDLGCVEPASARSDLGIGVPAERSARRARPPAPPSRRRTVRDFSSSTPSRRSNGPTDSWRSTSTGWSSCRTGRIGRIETLVLPRRPVRVAHRSRRRRVRGARRDPPDDAARLRPTVRDPVSVLLRLAHGTEGSRGLRGSCTPTTTRRCCARPRSPRSPRATSCCRICSVTSPRRSPLPGCAPCSDNLLVDLKVCR